MESIDNIFNMQQKIVPDMIETLEIRYNILKDIKINGPVGRRLLSCNLNITERVIRTETNVLKEQGLIQVNNVGMSITEEGIKVVEGLKPFVRDIKDISTMEMELAKLLHINSTHIIPGNVSGDPNLFKEFGISVAEYISFLLDNHIIISLTGGKTVKEVVDNFKNIDKFQDITILPARGGMGREIEIQSNTLVEELANKLNGTYELLHIPDNISIQAFNILANEDNIKSVFARIKKSFIVIHGIGNAESMCKKRSLPQSVVDEIRSSGAVGEAYGNYFDINGNIVYSMATVGIKKEDIKDIPNVIAVAAGVEKVNAIIGTQINRENSVLFTDEVTAREIIKTLRRE